MPTATVTSKGQITIPKTVRDLLQIETGDEVDFLVNDQGDVVMRPVSIDIAELRGFLKRSRKRGITVETMNTAIVRQHSSKR